MKFLPAVGVLHGSFRHVHISWQKLKLEALNRADSIIHTLTASFTWQLLDSYIIIFVGVVN